MTSRAPSPGSPRLAPWACFFGAIAATTFSTKAAFADDPAVPCRGDACADVPPERRVPLVVAADTPVDPRAPIAPPPQRTSRYATSGHEFAGARIGFGRRFTPSLKDAYYASVDMEITALYRLGLFSARIGLEGWGGPEGGGGGIPWMVEGGVAVPFTEGDRSPRFVLAGGIGWEWAYYDRIQSVGQFGIFAPITNTYIGLDFRGVRLFAEGSAQYRWGWGGPDHAQYRLGGTLTIDSELGSRSRE